MGALACAPTAKIDLQREFYLTLGALNCAPTAKIDLQREFDLTLGALTCPPTTKIELQREFDLTMGALTCALTSLSISAYVQYQVGAQASAPINQRGQSHLINKLIPLGFSVKVQPLFSTPCRLSSVCVPRSIFAPAH